MGKNKHNFKNYVIVTKINSTNLVNLELNYVKENSILIRNFKISIENIKELLNKLKLKFDIFYEDHELDINNNTNNKSELPIGEEITNRNNYLLKDMNIDSYKTSFNQNFYNNYLKNH